MKRRFTDAKNDEWTIVVNVGTAKAVRDATEVDLLETARGSFEEVQRVTSDPYLFGSVLYALCETEIEERGLSETEFAERFANADVIDAAATALLEAIIDFFPRRSQPVLHKLAEKVQAKATAHQETGILEAMERMERPEFDRELEDFLASAFSTSATNSPASSESTRPQ